MSTDSQSSKLYLSSYYLNKNDDTEEFVKARSIEDLKQKETLESEFKEFSLKQLSVTNDYYIIKESDIKSILESKDTSKELFLNKIQRIMKMYMKKYVAKYFTSYLNTSGIDKGNFIIGVSDFSEITGVPMFDTKENMKTTIMYKLKEEITKVIMYQEISIEKKEKYLKKVFELIDVEIIILDNTYVRDSFELEKIMEDYKIDYTKYKKDILEYNKERQNWLNKTQWYRRSINKMVMDKNIRKEMILFIENYDIINIKNLYFNKIFKMKDNYSSDELVNHIHNYMDYTSRFTEIKQEKIRKLKSEFTIRFETIEILNNRYNPEGLTFWLTQFRDSNVDKLILVKPPKKKFIEPISPYFRVIKNFSLITKKMIDLNINYCMIKIKFPVKDDMPSELCDDFYYYDKYGNLKLTQREVAPDGSPCCI